MSLPQIVSRDEWVAARKALLAKEKELTRRRDALNAERRRLPMVEIDKDYVFEGPDGKVEPARPVRGPPPAHRRPLHVRPELGRRLPELHGRRRRGLRRAPRAPARATRRWRTSRARRSPRSRRTSAKRGWTFPWYSSFGSDFNYDFHVTLDESVAPVEYNYRTKAEYEQLGDAGVPRRRRVGREPGPELLPARRRPRLPHVLRVRAGAESIGGSYYFLDETALGRQEDWEEPKGRATTRAPPFPDFASDEGDYDEHCRIVEGAARAHARRDGRLRRARRGARASSRWSAGGARCTSMRSARWRSAATTRCGATRSSASRR